MAYSKNGSTKAKRPSMGNTAMEPKQTMGTEAYDYHLGLLSHFQNIYKRGDDNKNMVFFSHWTPEEQQKHFGEDRIPLNFPLLYRLVMNLLGYEKNYPSIIQTEPVGKEDEITSFIYNLFLKYMQESTYPIRYKYQRSDVFTNANVCLYGVSEICVRTDKNGENEVYLKSIPFNQVMFDINFTDYEMDGCSRMQYYEDVYADDMIEDYPDKEELILNLSEEFYGKSSYKHKELRNFYDKSDMNKGKIILRKITDFKKQIKDKYCVYLEDKTYEFDTKQAAQEYVADIGEGHISERKKKACIYKTVLVNDVVVEEPKILDVEDEFPLTFYFPVFLNGEYTNVVEITRDLQKFQDRMYSQMDYNMGVAGKVLYEINRTRLDKTTTDQEVDDAIKRGGKIYTTTDSQVIRQNRSEPVNPQYFMVHEMIMRLAEDNFGGKNFQGVQQYSNQSGIAIEKLQAAAVLIASTYIDNLERYSENLGRKLVKYIGKYYTQKKSFKIIGDYQNEQLIKILEENKMYQKSLASSNIGYVVTNDPANEDSKLVSDFNYSVKIVNKDYNEYDKENQLQKLMLLQQQGLKVPPDMLLELMIDDPIVRQRLLEQYRSDQQAAQAQMIEEQKTARLDAMGKGLQVAGKEQDAASTAVNTPEETPEETPIAEDLSSGAGLQPQGGDVSSVLDDIINYV